MNTITVDRECGCFKRSIYDNNKSFESKDDALMQANMMVKHMNTKFCGKHAFSLKEDGENFLISMDAPAQQSGGCCGGGHCS